MTSLQASTPNSDTSFILTAAVERLSLAQTLEDITSIVAGAARALTGADGTTFVLKEGDLCYYVDEDAISPLWKGKKFPMSACISGWSMIHRQVVSIMDIYADERIPHDAYRPTFVKSLCMVPIRKRNPMGAIGNYWSKMKLPSEAEVKILQVLANSAAVALENLELKQKIHKSLDVDKAIRTKEKEFEVAMNTIAHDLRTPISAMLSLLDLLTADLNDKIDFAHQNYLRILTETGKIANLQIERMLSIYRAENGNLQKQKLDMSDIALEIIALMRFQLRGKNINFHVAPNLRGFGDPALIRLVLENLLSNAIKYSSKKHYVQIQIDCTKDGKYDTFFVKDNGDGFDENLAGQLFKPSQRLHSHEQFKGVGLGLASVAKIVEMHGGFVKAEGKVGEGASFYFSLPTL